jgi:hypothetical protein
MTSSERNLSNCCSTVRNTGIICFQFSAALALVQLLIVSPGESRLLLPGQPLRLGEPQS